jgi:preprotein translocase subunit YajC
MNPETPLQIAQTVPDGGASPMTFWLMMGALFLVMYAIIIHPQRKQQKQHAKLLGDLKQGDQVVTSGGIHGRITGIADDVLTVEIANNTKVKMERSAVSKLRGQAQETK